MRFSYLFKQISTRIILLFIISILCFEYNAVNKHFHIPSYLTIVICVLFGWMAWIISKELDRRFVKGLEGEDAVYRELRKLSGRRSIIHNFSFGEKGDVDYILILPTGIWVFEVKSSVGHITYREGTLYKNNYPFDKNPIVQIKAEINSVKTYIDRCLGIQLPINGAIVFSNPKTELRFGPSPVEGVYIVGIKWILKLIKDRSTGNNIISPEECTIVENAFKQHSCIV